MSVHRLGRPKRPSPDAREFGIFCCSGCGRPLELHMVVSADVDRDGDGASTGFMAFGHHCPCTPGEVRHSQAWGSHPSFLALFGRQPDLPYRSPFRYEDVANDDARVARWRWELSQVADWADFMLFLDANTR